MTDILDELQWRGLVAQSTDEATLRSALSEGTVDYYVGFDPTAPSLHIGNLVQILTARRDVRSQRRRRAQETASPPSRLVK